MENFFIKNITFATVATFLINTVGILSMDQEQEQSYRIQLLMPSKETTFLCYMPQSKCNSFNELFPHTRITRLDPFIKLWSFEVTPEQAQIIEASGPGLYKKGTAANRIVQQLSAEQRSAPFFPNKFFNNLNDGDFFNGYFKLGVGFKKYQEMCTNNFRRQPKVLPGYVLQFLHAEIINRDGSHGPNSHYAMNYLNLPAPEQMNCPSEKEKKHHNAYIN